MEVGQNTTYVQYELPKRASMRAGAGAAPRSISLAVTVLSNYRDYHALRRRQDCQFEVQTTSGGLRWRAAEGGPVVEAVCNLDGQVDGSASVGRARELVTWSAADRTWYRDFRLPEEEARGFDHLEDHLRVGQCRVSLGQGESVTFVLSTEAQVDPDGAAALRRRRALAQDVAAAHEQRLQSEAGPLRVPLAVRQLALAADQFLVSGRGQLRGAEPANREISPTHEPSRPVSDAALSTRTVIAGYPWFTDWGRDTMIALPGLTLCTGRFSIAREILLTWARYVDRGMIPNRFPDQGQLPEYHAADATLWYLWAIDQYARATQDRPTLAKLFPVMCEIVDWHRRGTRHNLHVAEDGLVYAGEPGVNLTWMDAKIGDRVIAPRIGKPIELSALWYDGLCNLARLARWLGADAAQQAAEFDRLAARTESAFARFWNAAGGCCYDVLDGPGGDDPTLRPNQIFAVSLEHSPLPSSRQRAVVATGQRELLTWFGLRSLGARESGYHARYAGGPVQRDEAYHQGTAWGWLLGPFVIAHFRVHRDSDQARQWLEPMLGQLWTGGMGSLSEVFDGDEPHRPEGCIAQAWSVAETLRAWHVTQRDLKMAPGSL